ncbi:MAG: hypothetical protein BM560_05430 [Roseobacter sp. MedPE-SWde]|nr:MAG: hypothetical protein BM560_05430 [Roseobacter sp. MedPE-SWde]
MDWTCHALVPLQLLLQHDHHCIAISVARVVMEYRFEQQKIHTDLSQQAEETSETRTFWLFVPNIRLIDPRSKLTWAP